MRRRLVCGALVVAIVLLGVPAVALAAGTSTGTSGGGSSGGGELGNPLTPGIPQSPNSIPTTTTTPTVVSTTSTGSSDSGLSGSNALLIGIGALAVLGGISLFIWRDARRRAPVRSRAAVAGGPGDPGRRSGSKQRGKTRKLSPAERRRRKRGRAR